MREIYQLIIEIGEGNKELYREIVKEYYDPMYGYVVKQIHDVEEAKDMTQEIFIKIYQNLHKYNHTLASFKTWIYKIATNHCLDYYQSKSYRIRSKTHVLEEDIMTEENILKRVVNNETIELLIDIMNQKLNKKHRTIFHLYYFAEASVSDIASVLNISIKTVYSAINLSSQKIQKEMEAYQNE